MKFLRWILVFVLLLAGAGRTGAAGGGAAVADIFIQAEKQRLIEHSEFQQYESNFATWDKIYNTAMVLDAGANLVALGQKIYIARQFKKFIESTDNLVGCSTKTLLKEQIVAIESGRAYSQEYLVLLNKQVSRIENLRKTFGELDFDGFTTVGGKTVNDIPSEMYNEMFSEMNYRTTWSVQDKTEKINEAISSGSNIPQKVTFQQGSELFKVVKKGSVPNPTTEYWFTKTELDRLMSEGIFFESEAGLPLGSMTIEYDVYKITANQPATTYRSSIAPTTQRGYTTTGGAFFGGATIGAISSVLSGESGGNVLKKSIIGGITSYGLYEVNGLIGYQQYKNSGETFNGNILSYRQFMGMGADYQRSAFWRREFGGVLCEGGRYVHRYKEHPLVNKDGRTEVFWDWGNFPADAWATSHSHYGKPGSNAPDGGVFVRYQSTKDMNFDYNRGLAGFVVNRFDASFHSFESHAKLLPFDTAILRYNLPYFYY